MAKPKVETIEVKKIETQRAIITITGDSDLIINKMNEPTKRSLMDIRKDKAKSIEKPDKWEEIITSIHWLGGNPTKFSEEELEKLLKNDSPCISAFGLKESFKQAVTRNKISTYSTEFSATMNVFGERDNLVPIKFATHSIDEKLMSPQRGKPVLVRLNRFSGWEASFEIGFTTNVYSLEQITNIINLAGFGLGIGSGRTSGYGRYRVTSVQ